MQNLVVPLRLLSLLAYRVYCAHFTLLLVAVGNISRLLDKSLPLLTSCILRRATGSLAQAISDYGKVKSQLCIVGNAPLKRHCIWKERDILQDYVRSRILDFAGGQVFAKKLYTSPATVRAAAQDALQELLRPGDNAVSKNLKLVFRHTCLYDPSASPQSQPLKHTLGLLQIALLVACCNASSCPKAYILLPLQSR